MVQILIIIIVIFLAGAILLLERRCLGKSAFVQPLVLCLIAGIVMGDEQTGLWFAVSLQLLSIGQSHYCNWSLAGTITGGALITLHFYGIHVPPGHPESLVLLSSAILFSILAEIVGRNMANRIAVPLRSMDLWKSAESFSAFSRIIYSQIRRGFIFGGLQSLFGTAVSVLLVTLIHARIPVNESVSRAVLMTIPAFGAAVTLGAMSGKRYPVFASVGVAVVFTLVVLQ